MTPTTPPTVPATPPGRTEPNVALGAMLFGTTIDEPTSFEILDSYVDAGGVWIDTADCYAFWADPSGYGGQSEELLGRWLAARPGARDRVRIATKVGCECLTPNSWPEVSEGLAPAVVRDVAEQSLRRMGIEHIDLDWAHRDDRDVAQADNVAAFGSLVTEGKVGRLGHSNTALWRTECARGIAAGLGVAGPTALQLRYSYLQPRPMVRGRDHDHRFGWVTDEVLDYAASDPDVDTWGYRPLIAGTYERADRPVSEAFEHVGTTRRLAALAEVADAVGHSRSEVVLAWLTGGTPAITPVIGVSNLAQLATTMTGVALHLPTELRTRLEEAW
ncbi:aldo/keto reductase [Occultella kanbiaonis]|uniref:aldo/keto reductase n=1 Tax=Occultella kanbiaonis TaxID=2675754 RepID=UPI0013D5AF21|nr:aldo/keto reductase [Occultella kanbiaonis]